MLTAKELKARKTKAAPESTVTPLNPELRLKVPGVFDAEVELPVAIRELRTRFVDWKKREDMYKMMAEAVKDLAANYIIEEEAKGNYHSAVGADGVVVARMNKYPNVSDATYDEIRESIGQSETALLFDAQASLSFDSIDAARAFVAQCEKAGITPPPLETTIKPRKDFAKDVTRLAPAIPTEKRELLMSLGETKTFSITVK